MTLTPDGRRLVVADYTGRIDVWEVDTGRLARRLQAPSEDSIRSVAVSPDGRWLACGRIKPDVQVWDLAEGKVVQTIPLMKSTSDSHLGAAERLAFSPDGKVLFTSVDIFSNTSHQGVTAWNVSSGTRLWNVDGVGYNMSADPRGRWVLTGLLQEDPAKLALLDVATGKLAGSMPIEPSWDMNEMGGVIVDASATMDRQFTSDGSRLVTSHGDGTLRVWDPMAGRELTRFKWGDSGAAEPGGLSVSPDGKWAAVRIKQLIHIWELSSGRQVHTIAGDNAPVWEMVFTPDGRGLIGNSGPAPILWTLKPKELPAIDARPDAIWNELGSADAKTAYRLQWALIENPKVAVKLFSARLRPSDMVLPRSRFDRFVAGLDSAEYAARERAERSLTEAGITVPAPWIRQALTAAKSEEVKARLRRVLAQREKPGPAEWRVERALQVTERIGTPEAAKLLAEWAAGPRDCDLTVAAGQVLARQSRLKKLAGKPAAEKAK